jgi:spermidine synthase
MKPSLTDVLRQLGLGLGHGSGPRIRLSGGHQVLHFGQVDIQSEMDPRHPDALMLSYTRLMMGFVFWQPMPRRVLMVGLGGGSLLKFCHRHWPQTDITVVEIDPQVIALREAFLIPPDGPRLRVVLADGAEYVQAPELEPFDVILVDGYDGNRMASSLGTAGFYAHCQRLLHPEGVLVCNLHSSDPCHDLHQDRLSDVFPLPGLFVQGKDLGNCIAFFSPDVDLAQALPQRLLAPPGIPAAAWEEIKPSLASMLSQVKTRQPSRA